jgi:hypothetical protein
MAHLDVTRNLISKTPFVIEPAGGRFDETVAAANRWLASRQPYRLAVELI